ncbi:MAG: SHOCT domain-containing protein [Streptosporangiales bacterium]|nr:SHOCT domain-containing protein [Streptosporangiales bacterium]
MSMSGAGWILPAAVMLILLVGAGGLAAVVLATMRRLATPAVAPSASGALAIARERYARGEIDHAELDRILDTLLRTEGRVDPGRG